MLLAHGFRNDSTSSLRVCHRHTPVSESIYRSPKPGGVEMLGPISKSISLIRVTPSEMALIL